MPRPRHEITDAQIAAVRKRAATHSLRDIADLEQLPFSLVQQIVAQTGRFAPTAAPLAPPSRPSVTPSRSYLAQWEAQKAKRQEEAATTPQSAFEELQLLKHLLEEVGEGLRRLECRLVDMGVE